MRVKMKKEDRDGDNDENGKWGMRIRMKNIE